MVAITIIRTARPSLFAAAVAASGIGLSRFFLDVSAPAQKAGNDPGRRVRDRG